MSTNENAVALRFADRGAARQAFGDLTRLGSAAEVRGAVLMERLEDGTVCVPAVLETAPGWNAEVGGLVGSLMGVLDGPLGMTVGWGIGAMIGDGHDHRPSTGATGAAGTVAAVTSDLPPGGTVVLVEVGESDPEALNLLAMNYDAVLERGSADAVRAELKTMEQVAELVREQEARGRRERGIAEAAETAGRRGGPAENGGVPPRRQLAA
ncbi:hypothetical protein F9278_41290 [Streptomyces phaeolivaceus]|uniref:DUF1269 domain-containing protein n=1 Tax=Streptomyces phaeolivaceus TaxID=2653200 RepID=A0A5P8KE01_9ACTN|nr:hypothetical protein [Streptomyces phaeolivaceus]QFR01554.1 hypothetical protein F9278_41290 [Streptomyces phaeolivaceus]